MVTIQPYPFPMQPIIKTQSFIGEAIAKMKSFTFPSFKCFCCTVLCPRRWNWKIAAPILLTLAVGVIAAAILITRAVKANGNARQAALLQEARALNRDIDPQQAK